VNKLLFNALEKHIDIIDRGLSWEIITGNAVFATLTSTPNQAKPPGAESSTDRVFHRIFLLKFMSGLRMTFVKKRNHGWKKWGKTTSLHATEKRR